MSGDPTRCMPRKNDSLRRNTYRKVFDNFSSNVQNMHSEEGGGGASLFDSHSNSDHPNDLQQCFMDTSDCSLSCVPMDGNSATTLLMPYDNSPNSSSLDRVPPANEVGVKRQLRLSKNRAAARECRRKKKEYVRCLEDRVQTLEGQNQMLIEELSKIRENNQLLLAEMSSIQRSGGMSRVATEAVNDLLCSRESNVDCAIVYAVSSSSPDSD